MANVIAIVGPPGTGKSYSLRNLNPSETFVVSVAKKILPFKGSRGMYSTDVNFFGVSTAPDVIKVLAKAQHDPKIKNIIIDDARYLMSFKYMQVKDRPGYDKFGDIADAGWLPVKAAMQAREDLNIIFMYHPTIPDADNQRQRIYTSGKLVDNHIILDGLFTIELFTHVIPAEDDTKAPQYKFMTNDGVYTEAKSPPGMFSGKYIDNDLKEVLEQVHAFYN